MEQRCKEMLQKHGEVRSRRSVLRLRRVDNYLREWVTGIHLTEEWKNPILHRDDNHWGDMGMGQRKVTRNAAFLATQIPASVRVSICIVTQPGSTSS